jgi:hypothetical protein
MSVPAAEAAFDRALASLRRGDAAAARALFQQMLDRGIDDTSVHLGLGASCQAAGDARGASAAADAALARAPRDLRALLLKAEALEQLGDKLAAAFYGAALRVAPAGQPAPPDWQPLLAQAAAGLQRHNDRFERYLREHLAAVSAAHGQPSDRFRQSLDILAGRRQRYVQAPRLYFLPELAQLQFFPRDPFPWLADFERHTDVIREEVYEVLRRPDAFEPYLRSDPTRPMLERSRLLDNPEWGAFFLWQNGEPVAANVARCPCTMTALASVPLARIAGRSPNVLFSLLRPGAHIPPHHGFINTRLIGHLPLIVPPGCRFRVGNETREWVEGRAWLFDDTFEHEAWNDSDRTRVVLLFEVWRPELDAGERAHVAAMFEAIDRLRGRPDDWGI